VRDERKSGQGHEDKVIGARVVRQGGQSTR
jgi:hypothetical protein